jgi:hypothetical protein
VENSTIENATAAIETKRSTLSQPNQNYVSDQDPKNELDHDPTESEQHFPQHGRHCTNLEIQTRLRPPQKNQKPAAKGMAMIASAPAIAPLSIHIFPNT